MVPPSQLIFEAGVSVLVFGGVLVGDGGREDKDGGDRKGGGGGFGEDGLEHLGDSLSFEGWGKGGFYHNFFDCVTMGGFLVGLYVRYRGGIPDIFIPPRWPSFWMFGFCARGMKIPE